MDKKRLTAFILIVLVTLGVVAGTSLPIAQSIKLGLDLKGGFEILYVASPLEEGTEVTKDSLRETARSLEERVNKLGTTEPEITPEGADRIRVKIAGVTNESEVREILSKPAELTFRGPDGKKEMLGSDFVQGGASVQFDQAGQPYIQLQVKNAEKFRQVTEKLLGQPLAIYLDETELSAPIVQSVIANGQASITGRYTFNEAKEIADVINLGALPLKLTEKYTQSVGATLGQQSLEQTLLAGVVGLIVILLFMVVVYRIPGLLASVSILAFTWLLLLAFRLMGVTLTLPGIAAFVLGIGMAVDANIITYERIKDEIRSGKKVSSALRAGSKNSFRTIMDANLTTIIAAAVILFLGSSSVKGFGVILIASIVASIITNVFFSRLLLSLLVRSRAVEHPKYFGVKEDEISAL
ncbi:protein translocase subunit SecD [Paenibacillus antri]|uniref:Protein translocase subunit SecD n=1 Tax=Paenibacillus antri TaxID=2582848 RepID=A0A5R9GGL1_9BACL|nr:protein translocase subunit SecD [Paenibacillus antri]TLS53566.1 protein translocase subunit SecD [Paenibacillus antri]